MIGVITNLNLIVLWEIVVIDAWWLLQAIQKTGACNAVRGAKAPIEELQYIYDDSDSSACVVETTDGLEGKK